MAALGGSFVSCTAPGKKFGVQPRSHFNWGVSPGGWSRGAYLGKLFLSISLLLCCYSCLIAIEITWPPTWRSGYCYLNKGECNYNQSGDDSFVEWVAKNNSWNNGDRHKVHEIFLTTCFVFVVTLVGKTVHCSAITQLKTHLMEKTLQLTVPS